MAFKFEGITVPTWATIKSYFTVTDQQHMLAVTNKKLDLFDCSSVAKFAEAIYNQVKDGSMPPAGPAWTAEMVNNFFTWWKAGCPCT